LTIIAIGALNPWKGPHKMTFAASENPPVGAHFDHSVVGSSTTDRADPFCPIVLLDQTECLSSRHIKEGPKQTAADQDAGIVIIGLRLEESLSQGSRVRSTEQSEGTEIIPLVLACLLTLLEEPAQSLPHPENGKSFEPNVLDSKKRFAAGDPRRDVATKRSWRDDLAPLICIFRIQGPKGSKKRVFLKGERLRWRQSPQPPGDLRERGHPDFGPVALDRGGVFFPERMSSHGLSL